MDDLYYKSSALLIVGLLLAVVQLLVGMYDTSTETRFAGLSVDFLLALASSQAPYPSPPPSVAKARPFRCSSFQLQSAGFEVVRKTKGAERELSRRFGTGEAD